jgi:hypothetical protein
MRSEMQKNECCELSGAELDAVTGGQGGYDGQCGGPCTTHAELTLSDVLNVWDKCMSIARSQ